MDNKLSEEITIYQQICQSLFMDIGLGQVKKINKQDVTSYAGDYV